MDRCFLPAGLLAGGSVAVCLLTIVVTHAWMSVSSGSRSCVGL
jgi:hypothetical protein